MMFAMYSAQNCSIKFGLLSESIMSRSFCEDPSVAGCSRLNCSPCL